MQIFYSITKEISRHNSLFFKKNYELKICRQCYISFFRGTHLLDFRVKYSLEKEQKQTVNP